MNLLHSPETLFLSAALVAFAHALLSKAFADHFDVIRDQADLHQVMNMIYLVFNGAVISFS